MKNIFLLIIVILLGLTAEAQNSGKNEINSYRKIVKKKFPEIENLLNEYSIVLAKPICVNLNLSNKKTLDSIQYYLPLIKADLKKTNIKYYKKIDSLFSLLPKKVEIDTCVSCSDISPNFLDSFIVFLANINIKGKDPVEKYINKTDLTILDSPPPFYDQDMINYKVYSGLSYVNKLQILKQGKNPWEIYKYIDTVMSIMKFINDDRTVTFSKFSQNDKKVIKNLIDDFTTLCNEYIDAKGMNYEKKSDIERDKLKSKILSLKKFEIYNYFLYLDNLPKAKK